MATHTEGPSERWAVRTGAADGTACDAVTAYVFGDEAAYALDLNSGTVRWSVNAPHSNGPVAATVVGGVVVAGFEDEVWAFDAATGHVVDRDADDDLLRLPSAVSDRGLHLTDAEVVRSVGSDEVWRRRIAAPGWALTANRFAVVIDMKGTVVLDDHGAEVLRLPITSPLCSPGPPVPVRGGSC